MKAAGGGLCIFCVSSLTFETAMLYMNFLNTQSYLSYPLALYYLSLLNRAFCASVGDVKQRNLIAKGVKETKRC